MPRERTPQKAGGLRTGGIKPGRGARRACTSTPPHHGSEPDAPPPVARLGLVAASAKRARRRGVAKTVAKERDNSDWVARSAEFDPPVGTVSMPREETVAAGDNVYAFYCAKDEADTGYYNVVVKEISGKYQA